MGDTRVMWCTECRRYASVLDVHEEEIGFEEQARPVTVTDLDCGHEVVR